MICFVWTGQNLKIPGEAAIPPTGEAQVDPSMNELVAALFWAQAYTWQLMCKMKTQIFPVQVDSPKLQIYNNIQ